MNVLVFFFVALAEVQVAVLSVLTARISSHLSNRALLCLQLAVICLRNTLRLARRFANVWSSIPTKNQSRLEIRKSQDLAKDWGGTANREENCKSKNFKLYIKT